MSIPSPSWSGFDIPLPGGSLRIHAYALCILLGIVLGLWLTAVRWKRRGTPEGSLWDIAIWAIPFGIVGGRLYHVISSPDAYFGPGFNGTGDLSLIPQIWRGGLGIWGAVVLGIVGAWIGCRRSGVKLTAFMDAAAPGLLLAQAIGRWGNWFNQELFGGPTTLPWGLQIDPSSPNFPAGMPSGTLFHPTFLYESIWNIIGVAILLVLDRRFHFRRGRLFWLYAIYYTLGRVWIEALRIDDAEQISLFGITTRLNVWTSIFVFVAALVVFIVLGLRGRPEPDTAYLPGHEPAAAIAEEDEAAAHTGADAHSEAGAHSDADEPAAADEAHSTIVTDAKAHDTDGSVSDTGAHGNLPNNQSDLGHTAEPTETAEESHAGVTSDSGSASTETTASSAPGSGPEAGSTK